MFQTFTYKGLSPELVDGFFLCDPDRLDAFLNNKSKGTDILSRFNYSEDGVEACKKGISIPVFNVEVNSYTIIIRHVDATSYLLQQPLKVSSGWLIKTETGHLVVCALSNLMFWDPNDNDRISDGEHNAYVHLNVLPGFYKVEIHGGINYENSNDEEWILEFVFSPVEEFSEAEFFADTAQDHFFHHYEDDTLPNSKTDVTLSSVQELTTRKASVDELVPQILPCLNKAAFSKFIQLMFEDEEEAFIEMEDLGKGIFRQPWFNSYGESLETAYVLQYLPLEILKYPKSIDLINDPLLSLHVNRVKDYYKNKTGYFGMVSGHLVPATKLRTLGFLTNLFGVEQQEYYDELLPNYRKLAHNIGLYTKVILGSYDSYIDLATDRTSQALRDFLTSYSDGITISLSDSDVEVSRFLSERNLSGAFGQDKLIYEPILLTKVQKNKHLLSEFENLIRAETKESDLEDFLRAYYKEIFGDNYDRVETQVWLNFPQLDITNKKRRLDIFLRNSISEDWELFELKRVIPLTKSYRDVPIITNEISNAILQVKNYARLLSHDRVKRKLAEQGIEYYEPSLNLVVGKTPNITLEQWRWLVTHQDRDVKILTYDDLLRQMKIRFDALEQFLK